MPRKTQRSRQRRSQAEMGRLLDELEHSGLSQRAFAERRGIPLSTLTWWRRKLGRARPAGRGRGSADFVPVVVPEGEAMEPSLLAPALSEAGFEVRLRSGHVVFVPGSFDGEALRRLVAVLDPAC